MPPTTEPTATPPTNPENKTDRPLRKRPSRLLARHAVATAICRQLHRQRAMDLVEWQEKNAEAHPQGVVFFPASDREIEAVEDALRDYENFLRNEDEAETELSLASDAQEQEA